MKETVFISIQKQLKLQTARFPMKAALYFLWDKNRDTETIMPFSQLMLNAQAVRSRLLTEISKGERALFLYPHGLDCIAAFLGCLYAGIIPVPAYAPDIHRVLLLIAEVKDTKIKVARISHEVSEKISDDLKDLFSFSHPNWDIKRPEKWGFDDNNFLEKYLVSKLSIDQFLEWTESILSSFSGITANLMSPVSFFRDPKKWFSAIANPRHTGGITSGGPGFAYEDCVNKITQVQLSSLISSNWTNAFIGAEPVMPSISNKITITVSSTFLKSDSNYPLDTKKRNARILKFNYKYSGYPIEDLSEMMQIGIKKNKLRFLPEKLIKIIVPFQVRMQRENGLLREAMFLNHYVPTVWGMTTLEKIKSIPSQIEKLAERLFFGKEKNGFFATRVSFIPVMERANG